MRQYCIRRTLVYVIMSNHIEAKTNYSHLVDNNFKCIFLNE